MTNPVAPFVLTVSDVDLDDLYRRLDSVRLPNRACDGPGVEGDVDPALVARLVARWRNGFDWRAAERRINAVPQVVVDVDGLAIHALHARADSPTGVPVLLLHGWPDSFLRYLDVVPRLSEAGHDVVVTSLPGHGLSEQPERATLAGSAATVHELMLALGYQRYAVHGGDWGSGVADALAVAHPEALVALHLTDVPFGRSLGTDPASTDGAERDYLPELAAWGERAVYFDVAGKQPLALAYGLTDSPIGLLAWMAEKYAAWTDRDPTDVAALDQVLEQVTLSWFAGDAWSAMRYYSEAFDSWEEEPPGRLDVPTALAVFPADIGVPPREHAERFFAVHRFTLMPRGGPFGALEHPDLLADDLLAFLDDDLDHPG